MKGFLLLIHLVTVLAQLAGPGGVRGLVLNSCLISAPSAAREAAEIQQGADAYAANVLVKLEGEVVKDAINTLDAGGGTNMYPGMEAAFSMLETVAAKIKQRFHDTRPITRSELLRTYDAGGGQATHCHFYGNYLYTTIAAKEAVFRLKLDIRGFDYAP